MRKTYLLFVLFLVFVALSCSKKESTEAQQETSTVEEWSGMDAFHMVMAEAFHPYKDSANLEPVKSQATELVKAADAWLNAPLPEKVNTEEVKTKLSQLKSDSEALAKMVTEGSDEEIAKSLTGLHDLFHELQESWYGAGEEKHDHDH
jgi:hypothetical protein